MVGTRDEREARQARDDGDPGDTVYGLPKTSPDGPSGWEGGQSGIPRSYHDDAQCRYIDDRGDVQPMTRARAQDRGLSPCKRCVLDEVDGDDGRYIGGCPFCDADDVKNLPTHLPDCPGTSEVDSDG